MDLCNYGEVKKLLERYGFRFSKAMGQNFLIDGGVPLRIAELSEIDRSFGVLEIGPGIGALTRQLSQRAERVVAVELDRALLPVLEETLAEQGNVEIVSGDILKINLPALVAEKMPGLRRAVCANLPYNITTPVLSALMDSGLFETITVMVQREVAQRICAEPGTSEYGAFTVYCRYHTEPEILFDVPPESFMPQPKVWSSVIRLRTRGEKPPEVDDEREFFRVVRAAFLQRRKTLVNALASAYGEKLSKAAVSDAVKSCGFDERVRGETLDIRGFAAVASALQARMRVT